MSNTKKYRVSVDYEAAFYLDIEAKSHREAMDKVLELVDNNDVPNDAVTIRRDFFIIDSEEVQNEM